MHKHILKIVFQNLNNRQQSAVLNAQQYFQMDMANLDNNQQANLQNVQLRQQTLLSDQAAQMLQSNLMQQVNLRLTSFLIAYNHRLNNITQLLIIVCLNLIILKKTK
jgi:hypothetical protein